MLELITPDDLEPIRQSIQNIELTPGPKGDTGPSGPAGPQGPKGNVGPQGPTANITNLEQLVAALANRVTALENGATDPAELPGWNLVFRDEFTDGLDKWNVRNNFTTIDTAKAMTANSTVEGGVLHLKGTWLATPQTGGPQGTITHHTGYVDTRNLADAANPVPKHFAQEYGRWEIRCETPTGDNTRGALAAFWLRNDSKGGEIDIMEAWGGGGSMAADWTNYIKNSAVTTIHSNTESKAVNGKGYRKTFWRHWQHGVGRDIPGEMHTYAFEYMPDYIAMFVDDVEIFRVTPTTPDPVNKVNSAVNPSGTLAWLWDADFFAGPKHMRINLHVGPSTSYWGVPDPNNRQWTVDPLDFKIEYVRVYAPA